MSAITNNYPFWYAMRNNDTIYLYLLVNVASGKSVEFPASYSRTGQTIYIGQIKFRAASNQSGHKYRNYQLPLKNEKGEEADLIIIQTLHGSIERLTKIRLDAESIDIISPDLPLPATSGNNPVKDVPYVFTQRSESDDFKFKAEVFVITDAGQAKKYYDEHNNPDSADNSDIEIKINITSNAVTEYGSPIREFTVANNLNTSEGAHSGKHGGRKGKTKNKDHTVTPFPGGIRRPRN